MKEKITQIKRALGFVWSAIGHHPYKTATMFFFELLQSLFVLLLPFVIKDLINAVTEFDPQSGTAIWDHIAGPFTQFILVSIGLVVFARVSGTVLAFFAPVFRIKPRERLVEHLQSHSVNFFQNRHSGALGNKIGESINGMALAIYFFAFDIFPILIKFIVSIALLFLSSAIMGWSMLAWSVVYFTVIVFLSIKQSYLIERVANARSRITGHIVDMATNIQAVKAFANEDYETGLLNDHMQTEKTRIFKFQTLREISGWFHSIMGLFITVFLMYIALSNYAQGLISVGEIAFIFSLILIVTEQSRHLLWAFNHFMQHLGQVNDGVKTILQPHVLRDKSDAKALSVKSPAIEYSHVYFKYPETVEDVKTRVFEDFDLAIPAGQKLGLIGHSGSGKSTLINLLLRFYDIDSGAIRIDGQDIRDVTQASLRENIAVISQDTTLFHRSLMDNIRYGDLSASDDDVIEAAKKAHAHDFIKDLPQGYQTIVGERGVRLSGGQRQRISIARAILKNAPILILDEATSALDSESEQMIQDSLKSLMEGKTVIAIAHRLSTIAHLDRLIIISEGRIIEDGKHDDLLKIKNGTYAKLWAMQSGGFLKI